MGRGGLGRGSGPIRVALLGSGGSIGRQAVDVLARNRDGIPGRGPRDRIPSADSRRAGPSPRCRGGIAGGPARLREAGPAAGHGGRDSPGALETLAVRPDVDLVVVATGGMVALRSVLAALEAGKIVATANKETLVAGGHLVMPLVRRLAAGRCGRDGRSQPPSGERTWLAAPDRLGAFGDLAVPGGESHAGIARLLLTASGGPFLDASVADLATVTPEAALRHPTWRMGAKITIDSATLANKGLEIIEARWLYDVAIENISVVVHPQSVVHSAVQFVDGSLKAQLGTPDMRLPIQYALTYPDRIASPGAAVDLIAAGHLDFRAPDEGRFPALRIAREAGLAGPRASAALIAADEVAVARFLAGSLDFNGIPRLLEAAVERFGPGQPAEPTLDQLVAIDADVHRFAEAFR